jgi:inhibitor of cysteine peptidase
MKNIFITKTDHGKVFDIFLGNLIVIQLPENPTTGFRWKVIEINNNIIVQKDSNFSISSNSGIGGGGTRTFSLTAIGEGCTKVKLKLLREWEPQNFVDSFEVTIFIKRDALTL